MMKTSDILEELRHLSAPERLAVLESTLHELRVELIPPAPSTEQLRQAAEALRQDYLTDLELTSYTSLDGEPIHA